MNKNELRDAIMKLVSNSIKKALNESISITMWNDPDFDNEADENGFIHVTLKDFTYGGREIEESEWTLEMLDNYEFEWKVKAICIYSEMRRCHVGDEVEFLLDKDSQIWDLDTVLEKALKDNY